MAKLISGSIDSGSVNKCVRYIIGGGTIDKTPKDERVDYYLLHESKKAILPGSTDLTISFDEKLNSFKLSIAPFNANVRIWYSIKKVFDEAIECTSSGFSLDKVKNRRVFIWVTNINREIIDRYFMNVSDVECKFYKKQGLDEEFPNPKKIKSKKRPLSLDDALYEPKFIVQDYSKYLECDNLLISPDAMFLFRYDFMKKLSAEIENPSDPEFHSSVQQMSATEIIKIIDGFNSLKLLSKQSGQTLIAPKRWLWEHVEYDGELKASLGYWCYIIDDNVVKMTIPDFCLFEFEEDELMFDCIVWDNAMSNYCAYLKGIEWNDGSVSSVCQVIPREDAIFDGVSLNLSSVVTKYFESKNVHKMNIFKLAKDSAIHCAYVMKLLIDENGMDWKHIFKLITAYGKLMENPPLDLLETIGSISEGK